MWRCGSERADELNICDVLEREGHETVRYNKFELPKILGEPCDKHPTGQELTPKQEQEKREMALGADVVLTWKGGEFDSEAIGKLRELLPDKPIYFIQHDLMENAGAKDWEDRDPTKLPTQHIQQARDCDAYFSKEIGWKRQYEDAGVTFIYWPEDACPDFYERPDKNDPNYAIRCQILGLNREVYPVIFTGTWMDIGIDRPEYLKPIRDAVDLTIFSQNHDAWVERGYQAQAGAWDDNNCIIVSKAKINLGLDWRQDIEGYWSDRVAQILGSGGFALVKYTLGMERAFGPDRENLVYWDTQQDCIAKIKYYLEHEEERNEIAESGYQWAKRYMTFDFRVRQFLTILEYRFNIK